MTEDTFFLHESDGFLTIFMKICNSMLSPDKAVLLGVRVMGRSPAFHVDLDQLGQHISLNQRLSRVS